MIAVLISPEITEVNVYNNWNQKQIFAAVWQQKRILLQGTSRLSSRLFFRSLIDHQNQDQNQKQKRKNPDSGFFSSRKQRSGEAQDHSKDESCCCDQKKFRVLVHTAAKSTGKMMDTF